MKSCLLAALLILATAPVAISASIGFANGETRYACGKRCAETQLICVRDSEPEAPAGLTARDIAAKIPLGQIDYWFMAGAMADRPEGGIVDGVRVDGPAVVSFEGAEWVWADYDLPAARGVDFAGSLVMWPQNDQLAILRCSFLANASPRTMIEELAGSARR
jgi:hypothetical protein